MRKDDDLWMRAQAAIGGGHCLTNSKRPQSFVEGVYPKYITHGEGCFLYDTDKRRYLDFICALGANWFGYGDTKIADALGPYLRKGFSHSFPTEHEINAAEMAKQVFPFLEQVRFLKTGSEACVAALKIARAKTGRRDVLTSAYHGWMDPFIALTPPALGCSPDVNMIPLNEKDPQITEETAAVIIEPVVCDDSRERFAWLQMLRDRCTETGTILIYDEVITALRYRNFSVAYASHVKPDLFIAGKALANGLPLSMVGGSAAIMSGSEYFISGTFYGETLSLISAKIVMETMLKSAEYSPDAIFDKGLAFIERFNRIWPEMIRLDGYGTRGAFTGDPTVIGLLMQEACRAGILFGKSWFINFPLVEYLTSVAEACEDILGRIRRGEVKLQGVLPVSPFSIKVRNL